jgi:hypothetical protein
MMAKGSKYTEAMVAVLVAEGAKGSLSLASLTDLANTPIFANAGITARGLIAKARTLGLPYEKVERKVAGAVVRKNDLVAQLEDSLGLDGLDSLAKADRNALRKLVDALT